MADDPSDPLYPYDREQEPVDDVERFVVVLAIIVTVITGLILVVIMLMIALND